MSAALRALTFVCFSVLTLACTPTPTPAPPTPDPYHELAREIKAETARTWAGYERYAWPHDNLLPLSGSYRDWYDEPIFISPIDGYSTLKLMGLDAAAARVERFVTDSLDFDRDLDVKVFEVNIRVLGGLLSMYELSGNEAVLARAVDFGRRLLPAFATPTGLPYYYVNLRTGVGTRPVINVAEAGSYLFEMGVLSYYSQDPVFYQTAKTATLNLNKYRSRIGLFGRDINVETGAWTERNSMVGAYADSYFEYLYKAWELFGDPDLKALWDDNMAAVERYLPDHRDSIVWYPRVDMDSGRPTETVVTLWDAYLPALLTLAGQRERAEAVFNGWAYIHDRFGMTPMVYDYAADTVVNGYHQLNPEVIESAYYLYVTTGKEYYRRFARDYYQRLRDCCRTDVAYTHLSDVRTGERDDEMATFFVAETMKYFYLLFGGAPEVGLATHVFSTEAHPFARANFTAAKIRSGLGITVE